MMLSKPPGAWGARPHLEQAGPRSSLSNAENPARDDGAEHGQAGNRPACRVSRTGRFRLVNHRIMPIGHDRLLTIFWRLPLADGSPPAAKRFRQINPYPGLPVPREAADRQKGTVRWPLAHK